MMLYKDGYKYQLHEDYYHRVAIIGYDIVHEFLTLDASGLLFIKKGYAWDGATCAPDIESVRRASLILDALYQLIRMKMIPIRYKKVADDALYSIMLDAGASRLTAGIYWKGVDLFGYKGLGKERPVLEAP